MACFLVSAAEAVVVTAVRKVSEKKIESDLKVEVDSVESSDVTDVGNASGAKLPLHRKLKWLSNMLWGGSFLLMFEHIWHGEVVPWFPFLTAMSDHADMMEMFKEMATVGVSMAVLITLVWAGICAIAEHIVKRPETDNSFETV
ncbi:MAG: hypothetical protein K6B68_05095 [Eubacterium sp.]|nr:hypothetical protein [Eubacterium sp.]